MIMPYVAAFSSARLPVSNAKAKRDLLWQPRYPSYREGIEAIIR
jgi:nucleoside-diphosphate-sugar epimerase